MTSAFSDDWEKRKQYIELPRGRRMGFIDSGGPGPNLLMLHGFSDTSRSFCMLEPYFREYRLIVPDLPGHGVSSAGQGMHVADFAETIDHLLTLLGVSRLFVLGHSMGAMTAIELGVRRGDSIRALALISATLEPNFGAESQLTKDILALSDPIRPTGRFLHEWYTCSHPVDDDFLSKMKQDAAKMPAAIWHGILRGFAETNLHHSAASVKKPVLCLAGSDDPLFGASHRGRLFEAFPEARTVTLAGHGHNPHWEDPQGVSTVIADFFADVMSDILH